VKDDPAQMRLAIYEFARARLQTDMSSSDGVEKKRLSAALEAAIESVEDFSVRQEDRERLPAPRSSWQARLEPSSESLSLWARPVIRQLRPLPDEPQFSERVYSPADLPPILSSQSSRRSTWLRFCMGILFVGVAAAAIFSWRQRHPFSWNSNPPATETAVTKPAVSPVQEAQQASSQVSEVKMAPASPGTPAFALPTDYGIYALSDGKLSELRILTEQVPDKRVAMSTPISQPSQTTLPDGAARFVLFRRDLAGNGPDRIDVRVVARVVRAVTFDAKGKPSFSPVSDAWNIRNISYGFRVRPIPGSPEMLLVQAENPQFALPPGRYILVLKNQGYDFTVAGNITDPGQCLERTDAANGAFYSDCPKK
jgi:hypothetical protein